ncbi:MAG: dienelactone hydrolase family protein [Capsulimonadaceae bacterium]
MRCFGNSSRSIAVLRATEEANMTQNGFAAAAQPISADTIHTPDIGLVAGDIEIDSNGFPIPAYRAMPEGDGPFPIVLVVQEIFGLHEYIKDVCRRLAHRGYVAVAPQTFARAGDPAVLSSIEEIRPIVNATPDAVTMADLDTVAEWAAGESRGDIDRLGITGFCWGGRTVWLYAAHSTRLRAGVAWYGRLAGDVTAQQPRWPIDVAGGELHAPVLGLYGGEDPSIPLEVIARMRQALDAAGSGSEIILYPTAGHAFHADYRPSYRAVDAADGETRLFDWLQAHGVG